VVTVVVVVDVAVVVDEVATGVVVFVVVDVGVVEVVVLVEPQLVNNKPRTRMIARVVNNAAR